MDEKYIMLLSGEAIELHEGEEISDATLAELTSGKEAGE